MSESRLGLLFVGAPRVPEMVALARRAEERGYESVWVAETRMTRDAFVPAAAIAQATTRIRVATGIVNVFTRGPVVIAVSFASLAELAPGRVVVGLGAGSPLVLAPQGVAWERPVTRLREYCDVLRPLLRGEEVEYEGRYVHLQGARIEDALSEGDGIVPQRELPLVLGATGRPAVALAGELADGLLANVCLPTEYVARARGWLAEGAARSGRDPADVELSMAVIVSPAEDSETGKRRAHAFCVLYLSLFPNIARETGLEPELVTATRAAFEEGGVEAGMRVLPRSVVDLLCAAGTPAECRERLDAYRDAGIAVPVVVALEGSIELALDTLR